MWTALVVAVFVVLELINNMILEPLLYGESAGVSEVALLVAIAFWTWLWGPVGLILATPLTVCVVVLSKYVPHLEFISVLMSDEPAMESNISYYQRLLAMDQAEAAEIVEEHLKTHSQEQLFDEVLIPALSHARRDRRLGRLTQDSEQFVFRATREIIEDLNSLKAQSSPAVTDLSKTATIEEHPSVILPKLHILGCPAHDEADELALLMIRQLLDSTRYEVEIIPDAMLTGEVVARIGEKSPAMILVAAVAPGGLAQTRYLCKRVRARFPNLKIAVGRWGTETDDSDSMLLAGADKVGTTMVEIREQIVQLCQIGPDSEVQNGAAAAPPIEAIPPKVVA